jgi:hypothetical protein
VRIMRSSSLHDSCHVLAKLVLIWKRVQVPESQHRVPPAGPKTKEEKTSPGYLVSDSYHTKAQIHSC